jgi:hypothetical protein
MSKDSIAVINGHEYKYKYNPESKQMDYLGPVGDAPPLTQERFREAMEESKEPSIGKVRQQVRLYKKLEEIDKEDDEFRGARLDKHIDALLEYGLNLDQIGDVLMGTDKEDGEPTGYSLTAILDTPEEKGVQIYLFPGILEIKRYPEDSRFKDDFQIKYKGIIFPSGLSGSFELGHRAKGGVFRAEFLNRTYLSDYLDERGL